MTGAGPRAAGPAGAYAVVLAAHGSRDPASRAQFEALVAEVKALEPDRMITHGFLEFNTPTIDEAAREAVLAGAQEIVLVPGVLLAASHAKNDLPSELQALRREFPQVTFHYGAAMDLHPALLEVCRERLVEAETDARGEVRRDETLLLIVGRGTTDPDANGDVHKLARFLEEGLGYGASLVCYSGTAKPDLPTGLARAARLGFARVVVLPYLLFDGVLARRVREGVAAAAQRWPETAFVVAGHLGPHPKVAQVFLERAHEGVRGQGHMNCSLCKYRVGVVGYEAQVGARQVGHHGAVRGLLGAAAQAPGRPVIAPYEPHPIERESFEIIAGLRDWSTVNPADRYATQRLVHTAGTADIVEDLYFSPGATEAGVMAILRGLTVVTDVTMVQSGLKRQVLAELNVPVWCGVHDPETHLLSREAGITRSAAGIRRAFEKFGNDCVVAIGDAPTAIFEAVRLIRERHWRPGLVIGLPVGFVGTRESKAALRQCLSVPRITNVGTRGGSPWASSVVNALMIEAQNRLAASAAQGERPQPGPGA
ncbi:precorrin-8X methylmutase (plasmid) [Deinococcus taeanensis]|uniref:precorrin-8X methylmutase n=1 Tax=Deinococcus taeanensis TaxID=2737050 RepID=UPI001CDCC2C8|nr:precorrin-8X methylmutase [Deinococcus taeanensis]UBV44394.1 precorrin-8X methylmutase [Deinococcus taeanensis]